MKKSDLKKLIQECFTEVLHEDSTQLKAAQDREKQEKEQWLRAKKAETDAELEDLNKSKTTMSEMARIPTVYSLSPDAKPEEYTGTIKQIAEFLRDHPNSTKIEIAHGIGKNAQQAVNMIVLAMEEKGIIDSGGLKTEPKYKKSDGLGTGLRGRKLSPEGAKKKAIKSVYDKLMVGAEDEITFEESELIGDEDMQKIRDLVAQGGIKKGRKPKSTETEEVPSEEDDEQEIYQQNDDNLFKGDEITSYDGADLDEPETPLEDVPELGNDELIKLIDEKDKLVARYKNGDFGRVGTSEALKAYRALVGDIPERIKALQAKEEPEEETDLDEIFLKERMSRIAKINIK